MDSPFVECYEVVDYEQRLGPMVAEIHEAGTHHIGQALPGFPDFSVGMIICVLHRKLGALDKGG